MPLINQELLRMAREAAGIKEAFVPSPLAVQGGPTGAAMGGTPPDPSMTGGAPPGAMPPGGAPPPDPTMAGGAPPMDPSMTGGAPPMDPAAAAGGQTPAPPAGGISPEAIRAVVREEIQAAGGMGKKPSKEELLDSRLGKLETMLTQVVSVMGLQPPAPGTPQPGQGGGSGESGSSGSSSQSSAKTASDVSAPIGRPHGGVGDMNSRATAVALLLDQLQRKEQAA